MNLASSHNQYIISGLMLLMVFGLLTIATPAEAADCTVSIDEPADVFTLTFNDQLSFSQFSVDAGNTAAISVTNNTNCDLPLSLGSYKVFDQQVGNQTLHDQSTTTIEPQTSQLLFVSLPGCMSQIDLYFDPDDDGAPNPPTAANPHLIGWTFQHNSKDIPEENDIFHFADGHPFSELDNFPGDDDDGYMTVPEANRCSNTPPALTASCQVTPDPASVSETVTWEVKSVSGGTPPYSYSWSGDVTGDAATETTTYSNSGEKTAQLRVDGSSSQFEFAYAACSMTVTSDDGGGGGGGGGDDDDDDDDGGDDGGDDSDDASFSITAVDPFVWMVAESPLVSTQADFFVTADTDFNEPLTITATGESGVITNNDTIFVENGGETAETATVTPDTFGDGLSIFVDDSIAAATYPVVITAEAPDGTTDSTVITAYVQLYTEF